MSSSQPDRFEETIRPISRPRGTAAAPATESKSRAPIFLAAASVLLVAGAVIVFFILPNDTDAPASATAVETQAVVDAVPEPVLSEEERRRLDAQSQRDLAALLTQQDALRNRGAADWGEARWQQYLDLARSGDDAYLADDVEGSAAAYAQALDIGSELLERSEQLFAQSVNDGFAAVDAADWQTAQQRFASALAIRPEDTRAQNGAARARALPQVLQLMREAAAADDDGELPRAIGLYRAALEMDADWAPARTALGDASGRLAQYQFDQQLDTAYAALTQSRFQDALDAFDVALDMRPNSQAAADGRFQAEEGLRLGQIRLAQVRALAFERRELWAEAIAQYEAALETDATLEYAIDGLERSRVRRDLEVKMLNLLDKPRMLFDDAVLAEARVLREQAASVAPRGAQIDEQLARLDALIDAATREYPVALVSDGLTSITVFRLGTIGAFVSREVRLRPGNYTAIGSRNGFRDVRRSFTVLPGTDPGPIEIICQEPI